MKNRSFLSVALVSPPIFPSSYPHPRWRRDCDWPPAKRPQESRRIWCMRVCLCVSEQRVEPLLHTRTHSIPATSAFPSTLSRGWDQVFGNEHGRFRGQLGHWLLTFTYLYYTLHTVLRSMYRCITYTEKYRTTYDWAHDTMLLVISLVCV